MKSIYSITELVKLGYSRADLKCIAHAKGSPAFKSAGGGKWFFDKEKLDKFIEKRRGIN